MEFSFSSVVTVVVTVVTAMNVDSDFDDNENIVNNNNNGNGEENGRPANQQAHNGRRGLNDINNDGGQGNQQRLRMTNAPIDSNLNNHVVFSSNRFEEITISDLERPDAI